MCWARVWSDAPRGTPPRLPDPQMLRKVQRPEELPGSQGLEAEAWLPVVSEGRAELRHAGSLNGVGMHRQGLSARRGVGCVGCASRFCLGPGVGGPRASRKVSSSQKGLLVGKVELR